MAWTTPRTWVAAELVTASIMNTHVRDNFNQIKTSISNDGIEWSGRVLGTGTHAPGVGLNGNVHTFGGTLTEAASGTHAIMAGVRIDAPTITTAGGATSSIGASMYVSGAPSGATNNYSIYVANGGSVLGGSANVYGVQAVGVVTSGQSFGLQVIAGTTSADRAMTVLNAGSTVTMLSLNGLGTMTLSQGAEDGIHFQLSSSDVAHGITTLAATDVYFLIRKASATAGGASIQTFSEGTGGMGLNTVVATADTTEAGSSTGSICLTVEVANGTGTQAMGADGNIVAFKNNVNCTHIFKGNGDSYEDGTGWTPYDDHDDIKLVEALEWQLTRERNPIDRHFSEFLENERDVLQGLGLVTFNENGRNYVNRSRMQNLLCGLARQQGRKILQLEAQVSDMRRMLNA